MSDSLGLFFLSVCDCFWHYPHVFASLVNNMLITLPSHILSSKPALLEQYFSSCKLCLGVGFLLHFLPGQHSQCKHDALQVAVCAQQSVFQWYSVIFGTTGCNFITAPLSSLWHCHFSRLHRCLLGKIHLLRVFRFRRLVKCRSSIPLSWINGLWD